MSDRPRNGQKKDHAGVTWLAHCGTWWSALAWKDLDASHRMARNGFNCGECDGLLVSEEQRAVTARAEESGHFKNALREPNDGEYVPFTVNGDTNGEAIPIVEPGSSIRLLMRVWEPFRATHLAFSAEAIGHLTILSLSVGRDPLISGPIAADYFAVRIPEDHVLPIDRGGPLVRPAVMIPTLPATIHVRNYGGAPRRAVCAIYGRAFTAEEMTAMSKTCG